MQFVLVNSATWRLREKKCVVLMRQTFALKPGSITILDLGVYLCNLLETLEFFVTLVKCS